MVGTHVMEAAPAGLAEARNNMVDGQLRPNRVTNRRILDVMRTLPREAFLEPGQLALAYADVEVPIGHGRVLLAPIAVGRLIQAAEAKTGARVLVLGAGYAAAVFAVCGAHVTVIEEDAAVLEQMRPALARTAPDAVLITAPFAAGWAAGAPYDVIFIDGAVPALPPLAPQLRDTPPGRLCAVLTPQGRNGAAVIAESSGAGLATRPLFDCTATPLPQFTPMLGFRF